MKSLEFKDKSQGDGKPCPSSAGRMPTSIIHVLGTARTIVANQPRRSYRLQPLSSSQNIYYRPPTNRVD